MKRFYSLLIALIMLLCTMVTPFSAYADDSFEEALSKSISVENDSFLSADPGGIQSSKIYTFKGVKYYGEGRELYTQVRDKIDQRENPFVIHYFSYTQIHPNTIFGIQNWRNNAADLVGNIFMGATDHRLSVSCTDGDYSRWNVGGFMLYDFTIDNAENGKYCYTFKLSLDYRYDNNQEAVLTQRINSVVNYVRSQGFSDYEALLYIHDYICDSTTYNYDAVSNPNAHSSSFSAYGALVEGKCVCQGYALAFYRICKALGYDVRFVSSDPEIGAHAWNLIAVDGRYYFVDLTWDDGYRDGAEAGSPYSYFLVNYDTLRANDKGSYAHTLFSQLYGDSYFTNNYSNYFAVSNYTGSEPNLMSKSKISLSAFDYKYTGSAICPSVYVTNQFGGVLVENVDYTVSYSDNVKCGIGTVNINGIGAYAGMNSRRSFEIKPTKGKKPTAKASNATEKSLTLNLADVGSTGYTVQMYKKGKWVTIGNAYSGTYKVKGLSPAKSYKFRVKPFEDINRNIYHGTYSSSIKTCTAPKKVKLSSVASGRKAMNVKWKKTTGSGYQIQYSTKKSMKKAKTVKAKGTKTVSKKIKGLKKGKKYYVRVRAYKTMKNKSGKTIYYYGGWSSKKAVKI